MDKGKRWKGRIDAMIGEEESNVLYKKLERAD